MNKHNNRGTSDNHPIQWNCLCQVKARLTHSSFHKQCPWRIFCEALPHRKLMRAVINEQQLTIKNKSMSNCSLTQSNPSLYAKKPYFLPRIPTISVFPHALATSSALRPLESSFNGSRPFRTKVSNRTLSYSCPIDGRRAMM